MVQSIVSLTMLLSKEFIKIFVLQSIIANIPICMLQNIKFFELQLFSWNIRAFNIISSESFNILLTNNFVSFEQLGPG